MELNQNLSFGFDLNMNENANTESFSGARISPSKNQFAEDNRSQNGDLRKRNSIYNQSTKEPTQELYLKSLADEDLLLKFGKIVQTERKITHLVLAYIAEIDTRQIYLAQAYPSLYEFLVSGYDYSPSAAIRRIESARLLRQIPEIAQKVESGALNLSQISKVQQALRTVRKTDNRHLTMDQKKELLDKIEFKNQNQTELILAQELSLPLVTEEKKKINRDESVTLTLTFDKSEMELLQDASSAVSHCVTDQKWSKVILYLAEKELKRRGQRKFLPDL